MLPRPFDGPCFSHRGRGLARGIVPPANPRGRARSICAQLLLLLRRRLLLRRLLRRLLGVLTLHGHSLITSPGLYVGPCRRPVRAAEPSFRGRAARDCSLPGAAAPRPASLPGRTA